MSDDIEDTGSTSTETEAQVPPSLVSPARSIDIVTVNRAIGKLDKLQMAAIIPLVIMVVMCFGTWSLHTWPLIVYVILVLLFHGSMGLKVTELKVMRQPRLVLDKLANKCRLLIYGDLFAIAYSFYIGYLGIIGQNTYQYGAGNFIITVMPVLLCTHVVICVITRLMVHWSDIRDSS